MVEKLYNKKKIGISTESTNCGQLYPNRLNNLSTCYPHSVDNNFIHNLLFRVKTQ